MCRPTFYDVVYSINPWMDVQDRPDPALAMRQWKDLEAILCRLGYEVLLVPELPDQPDMVFTANAAAVDGGQAISARFRHPFRRREELAYHRFLVDCGLNVVRPSFVNEGAGDFLIRPGIGPRRIYAASGIRTPDVEHAEVARLLDAQVVPLQLTNARFYHLDTALGIIDEDTAVVAPDAFSPNSLAYLRSEFVRLIELSQHEADQFGANLFSDGYNVILDAGAPCLADQLELLGYAIEVVNMNQFHKSGGGPRCCLLLLS